MLTAILFGIIRHVLTTVGGMLVMDGLHTLSPTHIAAGGAMAALGGAWSVASKIKVKTVSGADYSTLNK
jgi:hypothetical protein